VDDAALMRHKVPMKLSRNVLGTLLVLVILSAALFAVGHRDYPNLHLILDTGMCLLSGLLALLLRDLGARAKSPFPIWLAISFGVAFLAELVHVLVTIEWSGPWALIAQSQAVLRPATWPIAGFILPLGVGYSIWLLSRGRQRAPWLAPALILGSAGLFAVFISLPRYTPPGVLGITRPTLILVPPLWALISLACWFRRSAERILPALALMAAVLVLAHCSMLYSRAPHDTAAMIAHLGKIAALLILLLALMEMAASDMLERIRAEQQFAQLNEELERRIVDRTAELHLSYERMRAIVDTALDGLVTMNHEGRIVEFNPAAERIFGLSRGDAIGQTLADTIIPATDSPGARDAAVGGFILKMVRDCTDKKSQNNFIRGFADLMDRTGEKGGTPFGQRSLAERTAILTHFEQQGKPYSGVLGKVQHRLSGDSFFTILKRYTILGYCSSRRGATEGLRYDYIPGRYDGKVPLQPGQRSWATQ